MSNNGAFRLAILTVDGKCPRWMLQPLQVAVTRGAATLAAVVSVSGLPQRSQPWIVELYASWERRRYLHTDSLLDNVDVSCLGAVPIAWYATQEPLALAKHLAASRVDVLLTTPATGDADLSGVNIPVWRFRFGTDEQQQDVPGLLEVAERSLSSVSLVETIPGPAPSRVLERIVARTDPRSWIRNQLGLVSKASDLLQRWLPPHPQRLRSTVTEIASARLSDPAQRSRTDVAVMRLLARFGNHACATALNIEQWQLALGTAQDFQQLTNLTVLSPPPDRFWCDPFLLQRDGALFLFFEECLYASGKGHIAVLSRSSSGHWSEPVTVLKRPYHMSYPFIFEYEGELMMMPETTAAGRVELYRCVRFPDQWEFDRVLIDNFAGADATLWYDDTRWWLFADFRDELYIFHSDSPRGPWQGHAGNPVKSDSRNSRPAGRMFRRGNDVIRPAQDCSLRYGREVVFNRIIRLTVCDFEEEEVCRLQVPLNHQSACHTFNQVDDIAVVDRLVQRSRL
jgi:hypothetical protein